MEECSRGLGCEGEGADILLGLSCAERARGAVLVGPFLLLERLCLGMVVVGLLTSTGKDKDLNLSAMVLLICESHLLMTGGRRAPFCVSVCSLQE